MESPLDKVLAGHLHMVKELGVHNQQVRLSCLSRLFQNKSKINAGRVQEHDGMRE